MTTTKDDLKATIRQIKSALQRRSGKTWSVTSGRGTTWGWVTIQAPPRRREFGYTSNHDCATLQDCFGLLDMVHNQGVMFRPKDWAEYVARAEGTYAG